MIWIWRCRGVWCCYTWIWNQVFLEWITGWGGYIADSISHWWATHEPIRTLSRISVPSTGYLGRLIAPTMYVSWWSGWTISYINIGIILSSLPLVCSATTIARNVPWVRYLEEGWSLWSNRTDWYIEAHWGCSATEDLLSGIEYLAPTGWLSPWSRWLQCVITIYNWFRLTSSACW